MSNNINKYPIVSPPSYSGQTNKSPDQEPLLNSTQDYQQQQQQQRYHQKQQQQQQNQQQPYTHFNSSNQINNNNNNQWLNRSNLENSFNNSNEIPEDFLIGVTVSQSSLEIRMAFIRKVYSILFFQIATTAIVASLMRLDSFKTILHNNSWIILLTLIGSFISLIALFIKRHSSPTNLILLGIFTVMEAIGLGAVIAFVDTLILLEALVLTGLVFIGLTLYTLQTKRDFSGLGTYLGTTLMVMIFSSFLTLFFPLSRTMDAVYAGFGTLVFSLYVVYDTQMICKHLNPDDWVVACVSLYLDAVNIFINLVRVLTDLQER